MRTKLLIAMGITMVAVAAVAVSLLPTSELDSARVMPAHAFGPHPLDPNAAQPPSVGPVPRLVLVVDVGMIAPMEVEATSVAPAPRGSLPWLIPIVGLASAGATLYSLISRQNPTPTPAPAAPEFRFATPEVPSLLRAGKEAVARGALDEGIAWFDQALTLSPRLAVAHFTKGVCLAALGRVDEAYESLLTAYEIDPSEGAFRLELARVSARLGKSRQAMDALSPLIAAMPELAVDVADDASFTGLLDHPQFLAMTGQL